VVEAKPDDELEVTWRGHVVPAFTRSRVWLWNAGSATLDGSAIVDGYPLRLSWGDESTRLLSVQSLDVSRAENSLEVTLDAGSRSSVVISFEYLDPGQGAVFEILHTCPDWRASPSGTLKGSPEGLRERGPNAFPVGSLKARLVFPVGSWLVSLIALAGALPRHQDTMGWIGLGFFFLVAIGASAYFLVVPARRGPPAALRAHGTTRLRPDLLAPPPRRVSKSRGHASSSE
jgi:hypothetical protein